MCTRKRERKKNSSMILIHTFFSQTSNMFTIIHSQKNPFRSHYYWIFFVCVCFILFLSREILKNFLLFPNLFWHIFPQNKLKNMFFSFSNNTQKKINERNKNFKGEKKRRRNLKKNIEKEKKNENQPRKKKFFKSQ